MSRNRRHYPLAASPLAQGQAPKAEPTGLPGQQETERVVRDESPIVMKAHQFCPRCNSVQSNLVRTEPGPDGRMEYRKCLVCLLRYRAWDPLRRRPEEPRIVDRTRETP